MARFLVLIVILLGAGVALVAGALLGPSIAAIRQSPPAAGGAPAPARPPASRATAVPATSAPAAAAPAPAGPTGAAPAQPASASGDVTFEIDEATLTAQANAALGGRALGDTPLGPATLRQVAVQLRDGAITATGTAQIGATTLPLEVAGTAGAAAGQLHVAVSSVRIGGIPLPATMRAQIEQALQAQMNQAMAGQSLRIRSVAIANGKLTVVGALA